MNKFLCIVIFLLVGIQVSKAQIGINTLSPNSSSALDIRSNTKGLLIPSMNTDNMLNIVNPANGLMVYDSIQNMFFFYNKPKTIWQAINPWSYRSPDIDGSYNLFTLLNANVGIGRLDPQEKLHVAGNVKIDNNLYVTQNATITGDLTTNNITANNITGNTLSGNGAAITNVNALNLESHPASYFGTASDVTALQTGKADKAELQPASNVVTVSTSMYCGGKGVVTSSSVNYTQLGSMVFVSGIIYFNVTQDYDYICVQLTNLPNLPSTYGVNAIPANMDFYPTGDNIGVNYGGSLEFSFNTNYGNILLFKRIINTYVTAGKWRASFQFFYHIQ